MNSVIIADVIDFEESSEKNITNDALREKTNDSFILPGIKIKSIQKVGNNNEDKEE